jgi:hypothetical protein
MDKPVLSKTASVEAELHYFRDDVKMRKKIDISKPVLEAIGKKHNIRLNIDDKAMAMTAGFKQTIITLASNNEAALKDCIREILELYGKPRLPGMIFGGSKKKGKELTKTVMQELRL